MYPLHCNYVTTLPCKTITMKITFFITVLVLKSNKNIEISHFRLWQLANSSKLQKQFLWRRVQSVCPQLSHKLEVFWLSMALSVYNSAKTVSLKTCSKCPPPAFTQARSLLTQYCLVVGVLWQIITHCLQDFLQLVDGIGLWYINMFKIYKILTT